MLPSMKRIALRVVLLPLGLVGGTVAMLLELVAIFALCMAPVFLIYALFQLYSLLAA